MTSLEIYTQREDEMINLHGIGTGEDWEAIEYENEHYREKLALDDQFWNPEGVLRSSGWQYHVEPPETNVFADMFIERPKPELKPVYPPVIEFSVTTEEFPVLLNPPRPARNRELYLYNPLRKLVILLTTGRVEP